MFPAKISTITAIFLLMIASLPASGAVEDNCSLKWSGDVQCEFTNMSDKKASMCVQLKLTRRLSSADAYSFSYYGDKGEELTSGTICSGIVEPQDVRERRSSPSWAIEGVTRDTPPYKFCEPHNQFLTVDSGCDLEVVEVKNS